MMRDNTISVRSRKQEYINATEGVLKLLKVVKDNSSPKSIERTVHQIDSRDGSLLGSQPCRAYSRREKKNSLKEITQERVKLLPYQSKLRLFPHGDGVQPLFPQIARQKIERFSTDPAETKICSTMNLTKKDEAELNLKMLRSKKNLYNVAAFEDSLHSQPQTLCLRACKKRVRTEVGSHRPFESPAHKDIATLEKVLITPVHAKVTRKEFPTKPSDYPESGNTQMTATRRLMEGAYSGWEFETTNGDWSLSLMQAIKRRHR